MVAHTFIPQLEGAESIVLAAGILGATVTPYAVILHSALTQDRVVPQNDIQKRRLFRFEIVDAVAAMGIASLVNMAMRVMAAGTFHQHGMKDVGTLEQAYKTLQPLLGHAATWVFAVSLIASGLSAATTVTQAGQIILSGFLNRRIPIWLHRLITMVPPFLIILAHFDPTQCLVVSQVILGNLVNRTATKSVIVLIVAAVIALNAYLLYGTFTGG